MSVVIPVHNAQKAQRCVKALNRQTYNDIEIIQVSFKGFPAEKRNYGFKKSRGSFALFLDEDEYLSPTVVEECVKKAEDGYDIVAIPVVKKVGEGYFSQCLSVVRESTVKTLFFKRIVLEKIGLFNPKYALADDIEILQRARRAGCKIGVIPNGFMVHDEEKASLKDILRKTLYARHSFKLLKSSYGASVYASIVRSTFHRKRILKELIKSPKLIAGVALIMLVRFLARRTS